MKIRCKLGGVLLICLIFSSTLYGNVNAMEIREISSNFTVNESDINPVEKIQTIRVLDVFYDVAEDKERVVLRLKQELKEGSTYEYKPLEYEGYTCSDSTVTGVVKGGVDIEVVFRYYAIPKTDIPPTDNDEPELDDKRPTLPEPDDIVEVIQNTDIVEDVIEQVEGDGILQTGDILLPYLLIVLLLLFGLGFLLTFKRKK